MITNITIDKVFTKMSDIKPVIIVDIDEYLEVPQNSHFKASNLNEQDIRILLDIYVDKIGRQALKSNKPTIDSMKDESNLILLAQDISELTNYENYPDLKLLKKVWFTRKSFGRSKIKYIKAQLK